MTNYDNKIAAQRTILINEEKNCNTPKAYWNHDGNLHSKQSKTSFFLCLPLTVVITRVTVKFNGQLNVVAARTQFIISYLGEVWVANCDYYSPNTVYGFLIEIQC